MKHLVKSRWIIAIVAIFLISNVQSQIVKNQSINSEPCGFDLIHNEMMQNDPLYLQKTNDFNHFMKTFSPSKVSGTTYKIPVVVHVMETGNSLTAITDAQIRESIRTLNERYRKVPGSIGDGGGVDVTIEFALAVRNPAGNCTNGIVRYDMTGNATYMASGVYRQSAGITDASLKALSVWNQSQYYNIWLVSEIDNNNGGSGIQGYAYFASAHGTSVDGTVMLASNFMSSASTTGAHEIGHALNLYHTFEGDGTGATCPTNTTCSTQGDRVCDTPPHRRSISDCVVGTNSCDGGSSTNLFIHNYMDYSSDACQSDFTAGQKTRMIAALTTTRSSFLQSNGNMSLVPPSAATAAFRSNKTFVCSGESVQFYDNSSCTPNTFLDTTNWSNISFLWTFTNGGTNFTSTLQNPLMTLPVGVYDVSLSVTNAFGTNNITSPTYLVIGTSPVAACTPGTNNVGNYAQTVNNVSFNTLSNSTSTITNVAYTNFACSANTIVTEGLTYPLSIAIRAGGSGAEVVEAFIDYNNNGVFDVSERVLVGTTPTNTSTIVTANVTIPLTAVKSTLLRMRVIGEAGTLTNTERYSCANTFIGDVEDYGVYIMPNCIAPAISTQPSSTSVCQNGNTSFTVNATGTTITYQWQVSTNGGGAWSNISNTGVYTNTTTATVNLTNVPTSMTTYRYRCVITNACGSVTSSNATTLTVNANPVISIASSTNPSTCATTTGSIQVGGTSTGNLTWTGPVSGSATAITLPRTISSLSAGNYTINFVSTAGCSSNTLNQTLNDPSAPTTPTISASGPLTFCQGGSVTLTSSYASGNLWSTGATTQSIVVSTAGSYNVRYTDGGGCSATSTNTVVSVFATSPAPTITPAGPTAICAGSTVNLSSSSATNNIWSTGATTQVIAAGTPGFYTVRYTDGNGCLSAVSSAVEITNINVGVVGSLPFNEGFTGTFVPANWTLINPGGTTTWQKSTTVGLAPTPGNSMMFDNYNFDDGANQDEMQLQTLNFSGFSNVQMTFDVAYARYSGTNFDGLQVLVSTDCGTTFTSVYNKSGTTLATAPDNTASFTPTTAQWRQETINLTPYDGASNVIIKYRNLAGYGNRLFIDNINLNGTAVPVASFTGTPTAICAGQSVTYTNTSTGSPTSYSWTFPGGTPGTSTATNPVVTYAAAGSYNVSLTATNAAGSNNSTQTNYIVVTAAPIAGTLSGTQNICTGSTTTFSSTQSGGAWSSSNTGIATVNSTTGVVTAQGAGTATITYTVTGTGGCANATATRTVTVTTAPVAGTLSGTQNICSGSTTTFASTQGGGAWSSSNTGIATVNSSTGVVTGVTAGTATITYTVTGTGGCSNATATRTVTVTAAPVAGTLSGTQSICTASTTTFSSTQAGGAWSSSNTGIATVNSGSGLVTAQGAGTATITYTVTGSGGCSDATATRTVTVTTAPVAGTLSGTQNICTGTTTAFTSTQAGGAWSSSNTGIATVNAVSGLVTAQGVGTATMTYTVTGTGGCSDAIATRTVTVTTAPVAGTLSGIQNICTGTTTTFSSTQSGGTWSSSNTGIATVNSSTGVITAQGAGTATITYTVTGSGGCSDATATRTVTVTSAPVSGTLSGTQNICSGSTTTFASTQGGGAWSSSNTGIATVNSTSGVVTGVAAGTATITYTVTGTGGCSNATATRTVTVTTAPVSGTLSGTQNICSGSTTTFASTQGGGTWSSSNTAIATVNSTSGVVTGVAAGTATITYIVTGTGGCSDATATRTVTVTAAPVSGTLSGTQNICSGSTTTFASTQGGGTWSSSNTGIATVNSSTGVVTGVAAGTATITYTVTGTGGCSDAIATRTVTVTTTPAISLSSQSNPTVCGASNGQIGIGGSGAGTISWTGTTTGSTAVTLPTTLNTFAAGTYTLTFNNGCTSNSINVSLSDPSAPAAPVVSVTNNCGSTTLTTSGSNLLWSTGATTTSINVNTAGTYSVTQTVGGCTSSAGSGVSAPLAVPSAPVVSVTNNCGSSTLTTSGSNLLWSTGETTTSINVTTAATYTVTQTVGSCTSSPGSGVAAPNAIPSAPVVSVANNCGSSTLTTSGSNLLWSTGATTASINVTSAGTYTVTQTVGGCTSSPGSGVAAPNAVPSAPIVSVTNNCGSSTLTTSGTNLLWSTGATTASINVTTAGTYTVTQTVGGCTSAPGSIVAAPNAVPSAPVVSVANNCGNSTLTTSGTNLLWSTGATTTSINVTTAGTFTVTQTVGGCTSSPGSGVAAPNSTPSTPVVTVVDNCGSSTLTTSGSNLIWSTGATTASINVTTGGTYTVTQTVGGCVSSAGSGVATPLTVPTVTQSAIGTVCINNTPFTLTGGSPSGGVYSGVGISGGVFDPSVAGVGNWTVDYTYTDANSCSNSASVVITVDACAAIEESGLEFGIHPNPTTGQFKISGNASIDSFSIFDYSGRLIEKRTVSGLNETSVDLSNYADGVYSIVIQSSDYLQTERIILKK